MKKIVFIFLCLAIGCALVIGGYKGVTSLIEKYEILKAEERKSYIEYTLYQLGDRSLGTRDWNTAQYSMALGNVRRAALGESNLGNHVGMTAEEIKKSSLKDLEVYFNTDYVKSYASMVFGADYLTKEDMEYFYREGEKITAFELQERVEELLNKNNISLSGLLINPKDEEICYTTSLRIKLAEDGCISSKEIVSELYDFVYEGKGFTKVKEELLAGEITYLEIVADYANSFSDEKVYFADLSAVGKMVFLYLMPRYVLDVDQEAGSTLWYNYFQGQYEKQWDEIINRPIFSGVLE